MAPENVFTEDELAEMGTPIVEQVYSAIDKGENDKPAKLVRRMYKEWSAMHNIYRDWITALLSFIGEHYGDEELQEALKYSCASWFKPVVELCEKCDREGDIRRKAEIVATGIKAHLMPMRVIEDEEKFIFEPQPCGSGGLLVQEGYYDLPDGFLRIKNPQPMTCGKSDFPVYCAHAPIMTMLAIEWTGAPVLIEDPSDSIGEKPCRIYVYKNPKDCPEDFYLKVGKKKNIQNVDVSKSGDA